MTHIFDIAALALMLVVVWRYSSRGFLADLVALGGSLGSMVGAWLISNRFAPVVYRTVLQPVLLKKVSQEVSNGTMNITELLEEYGSLLPASVREKILSGLTGALQPAAAGFSENLVENVVAPLVTPMISMVLFFVTFTLLRMAVSLLVGVLKGVNEVPLAGSLNRNMGLLLGVAAGILDVFLMFCILWSLMALTGGKIPLLSEQSLSGNWLYRLFSLVNPFL